MLHEYSYGYLSISGGRKVLVGIYRTDVEDWFMEWYNGGIIWKGNR